MKDLETDVETHEWLDSRFRIILSSAAADGQLAIVEMVSGAESGPPRHVHHDADETFVILSGDLEFWLDGETFTRGPGQTAFIPRGTEHTFRVLGDRPARKLSVYSPGGFEEFFAEMARGGYRIPEDMEKVEEIGRRHHLTFTGPPLGV